MNLSGKVAVVPVGEAAVTRTFAIVERLAAEGARVVLVTGADAAEDAGRLAAAAVSGSAVFHLDDETGADLDALAEFLGEMFRDDP